MLFEFRRPNYRQRSYGHTIPQDWKKSEVIDQNGLLLSPGACVLACSRQRIRIPLGYFGLIQTEGSLARLFVGVQISDGQVEGGYQGKVTFELVNLANYSVILPVDSPISQLFIFKTSTRDYKPYAGRYNKADLAHLLRSFT